MDFNQYNWYPYKRGNMDTGKHTGRMPAEHYGRDQGDASTSQGTPKMDSKSLGDSSAQPPIRTSPDKTLILDFLPPEL